MEPTRRDSQANRPAGKTRPTGSALDLATRLAARKEEVRRHAHAARRALQHKDSLSLRIHERIEAMSEYHSAATILYYVDVRDEVRTRPALAGAVASGKRIVIPYCVDRTLELFLLESVDELAPGAYRIPEPKPELRRLPHKQVAADEIDLLLIPGLAFDQRGGRIGYGKGYYDRLLAAARPDALLCGLAFDCQIFDGVPMQPHDVFMDRVVTETDIHQGQRGR